jgi:hypothetical protein
VIREAERRASLARTLEDLRARQRRGLVPGDLDVGHLLLTLLGVLTYPLAFPQVTRMVMGKSAADPAFRRQHTEFLRRFAEILVTRRPQPAAVRA